MSAPPGYEFETRPIVAPPRLVLPIVVAAMITGVAIAGAQLTETPRAAAPEPSSAPAVAATDDGAASVTTAPAPVAVVCGSLDAFDCRQAVDAARLAIADVPVTIDEARASPTLMCGSNLDCPLPLLQAGDPIGSVTLTLTDRGVVWVNVFRVPAPNRLDDNRERLETRVVRWVAADS